MSLSEAICDKCNYTERFSDTLRTYELGGDQKLNIQQTFAWCPACKRVVWAEQVPNLSQLEVELQEILEWRRSKPQEVDEIFEDDEYDRFERELRLRIIWRKNRVSSPKCLECGSTSITLAVEHEWSETEDEYHILAHPGCSGTITIRSMGLSNNRLWIFYTPEGDHITSYTVSPSRGLVPIKE